jgi:hypothetical protein
LPIHPAARPGIPYTRRHIVAGEFHDIGKVVDPKYLDQIRAEARGFSTKRLARHSRLGEGTIRNFKNGKGKIRPRSLRKLIVAIHDLQSRRVKK